MGGRTIYEELKSFDTARLAPVWLGQRGDLHWVVCHKGGLDQVLLHLCLKHLCVRQALVSSVDIAYRLETSRKGITNITGKSMLPESSKGYVVSGSTLGADTADQSHLEPRKSVMLGACLL